MPGARSGLFTREAAHPAPTLDNWYATWSNALGSISSGATTTLSSTSFAVNAGDLIVVKAGSSYYTLPPTSVTWTGVGGSPATKTALSVAPTSYTATTFFIGVAAATGTMTVTATYTASAAVSSGNYTFLEVERWTNARWDATCAYASLAAASGTTQSSTLTPTSPSSMITWMASDYTATSPAGAATLLNGATALGAEPVILESGFMAIYLGYQPSLAAGVAQTFGLTTTVAQKDLLTAMEIKPIAA